MAAECFQSDIRRRPRLFCGRVIAFILISAFLVPGCSSGGSSFASDNQASSNSSSKPKKEADDNTPDRDNTPRVLTPEASGKSVFGNDIVSMDLSNVSKGYMMLTYSGSNEKVKFQVQGPDGVTCTYLVEARGEHVTYPLTGGDGGYTFTLYESADLSQDLYAVAFTESADVTLEDKFLPYLTPNVYVDYNNKSKAVSEGSSLAEGCKSDLDTVENIYLYVTENIKYDTKKAENIAYGYIPDVDHTLKTKKGICFDYAALMTAMLRTQRIPTRLEVGYSGEIYHAWISCYLTEKGWVDNVIEFDGKNWSLMDPTLASNNGKGSVKKYVGDGSNYTVKYTY